MHLHESRLLHGVPSYPGLQFEPISMSSLSRGRGLAGMRARAPGLQNLEKRFNVGALACCSEKWTLYFLKLPIHYSSEALILDAAPTNHTLFRYCGDEFIQQLPPRRVRQFAANLTEHGGPLFFQGSPGRRLPRQLPWSHHCFLKFICGGGYIFLLR